MLKTTIDAKIERLEAELKNAKRAKTKEERRERNNQLVAFGIMLEQKYKNLSPQERSKIRDWAETLDERNKKRALAGFERLEAN